MLRAQGAHCPDSDASADAAPQDGGDSAPLLAAGLAGAGALALSGRAVLTGKAALLLLLQSFSPPAWRLLRAAAALWVLPWRRRVQLPAAAERGMAAVAPPVLVLSLASLLLRQLAPDTARTLRFWRQYLPLHARYALTRRRYQVRRGYSWQEVEAAWARRHEWGGPRVRDLLRDMSGYYVKSAQILASKSDFLPEAWTSRLTPVFFDSMKPRPFRQLQQALLKHLQATPFGSLPEPGSRQRLLQRTFEHVEPQPLACASIAQVHGAALSADALAAVQAGQAWPCGGGVVVKVQHADMQGLMESDIRNLRRLCAFVESVLPYDPTPMLDEMAATVGKEFDFLREALLMRVIGARLAADGLRIRIPRPALSLCSRGLLVMQRLEGIPFSKLLTGNDPVLRARAAAALPELLKCYGIMIFRDGLFHEDGGLALLDFGQCKALPAARHAALARLICAIAGGDDLQIMLAMSGFGMDFSALGGGLPSPEKIRKVALICFDTRQLPEARIHPLAENAVIKSIPLKEAPEDLFSLGRTIMLLRGLCFALGVDLTAAEIWRPYAEAALRNPRLAQLAAENQQHDTGEAAVEAAKLA